MSDKIENELIKYFNTDGVKYQFIHDKIQKELKNGIGDINNIVSQYILNNKQQQIVFVAKQIEFLLNENERMHPRNDPALSGLRTDQWRVFAYLNQDNNGKQVRLASGRFDFKFRFVAINMQKPFRYRFDFSGFDIKYGKLLINMPIGALTAKERKKLLRGNPMAQIPQGYIGKQIDTKKLLPLIPYSEKGYGNKDPFGGKVGSRRNQTVGNLAAVRLAISKRNVYPKKDRNYDEHYGHGHAHKIVFWVGHAKRMDSHGKALRGNRIGTEGYIFLDVRRYNSGGHDTYKRAVNDIINKEVNTFMDTLW